MYKSLVLFACFAVALCAVRREAPAGSSPWQDLEKNAAEFSKTISEQLNAFANSKNTDQFNKAVKDGSDSVLQTLSSFSGSLQAALADANGKVKEALQQSQAKLKETADQLRQQHPDVEANAEQLRARLADAVRTTAKETEKLAKEAAANWDETSQKLAPQVKQAYEQFVKQAEAVQKKLHEAATKQ
ncbi:apolipophorin-3-like [Pectinophora gossypiella]|nr:apolipophorin-3-like [Pectinophora gossypiella]